NSISFQIEEENVDDFNRAKKAFPDIFKNSVVKTKNGKASVYISDLGNKGFAAKVFDLKREGKISFNLEQTTGNTLYNHLQRFVPERLKSGALPTTKETIVPGQNQIPYKEKGIIDPE